MWFIKYKDNKDSLTCVDKLFDRKVDAYTYIKGNLKDNGAKDILILNAATELIPESISEDSIVFLKNDNEAKEYGKIQNLSSYLVTIHKTNKDTVNLTKERVNKEYIKGILSIS